MTLNKPVLFSVLVANYNNGRFFRDCYSSILAQSYSHWEVIIVDDASTDDSVERIEKLILDDARFKLFKNQENKGCGFTKRKCADLAKGDILGFLDPDDALYANALKLMVDAHFLNPDVSIVSSKHDNYDIELEFIEKARFGSNIPKNLSFLTYGLGAITHFATFKRLHYFKTEGIDPKLKRAVDQDLYFKLEEQGKHLFIDAHLYKYRQYGGGISQGINKNKAEYSRFIALEKAFRRRKKLGLSIDNFSDSEFNQLKSNHYIMRMQMACSQNRFYLKYFFLFKSIFIAPLHKKVYKLKAFLNFKFA